MKIKYIREYQVKYYSIDNYLEDYNLMIEIMGDYWHSNPNKYNENKYLLNEKQADGIHRDKLKHSYIKNHLNVEVLYLWESDINNNIELCKSLIEKYISSNGNLPNYHSFNWKKDDRGEMFLCENLIISYQDIQVDEYRNIIKKKVG